MNRGPTDALPSSPTPQMTAAGQRSDPPAILGGVPLFPAGAPAWPSPAPEIADVLQQMGADSSWGHYFGPHADRLIERLRQTYDCQHVLLCSSGRVAIELALRGIPVEPGDEVVMAAYDFHSNFTGIHQLGALPVLAEVRRADAQLDVADVESAISSSTKAILASHLHGGMVDMPRLRALADERGLAVIEDACQASGAVIAGRVAGTWGDVGAFSFGGSKLLTAGRGGAVLTNRDDVIQRIRRFLRGDNHCYPLSEMQAAVLLPQLERLPERHQQRCDAVAALRAALCGCHGLRLFEESGEESSPAFYKVGLFYDASAFDGLPRERFVAAMRAEGLALDAGFPSLHTIHGRRRFRAAGELTSATSAGETVVGLHHPVLLNREIDWQRFRLAIEQIRHASASLVE
jgi:dTDP-4-amino-4,6-dideoxygalactose transaminase